MPRRLAGSYTADDGVEQHMQAFGHQLFRCVRCQKWRSFCLGHSEGDECILCEAALYQKLVDFVARAPRGYRSELELLKHLLGKNMWAEKEPTLSYSRVEDMLFYLVEEGRLAWFGDNDRKRRNRYGEFEQAPLKYRIPTK